MKTMKPRYKFVLTGHRHMVRKSTGVFFESVEQPGHIWLMARRNWILLRVLP